MTDTVTNWAGNITFGARRIHRPSSLAQLRELVAGSERIRALGTGHSFSRLADTSGDLVSVAGLDPVMDIDTARGAVTVSAGVRYGELARYLDTAGYALHNLASLPHISVAGAVATGTHGSGDGNGNLSTAVSAMELVDAGGDLVEVSREADGERFDGMVVALGGLGIVTRMTLDVEPAFDVRQYVYEDLPRDVLDAHWAEIFGSAYSVSLFTDWRGSHINQVWLKQRLDGHADAAPPARWMGATLADGPRHPLAGMPAQNCTEQLGVPGPWYARLPHFRLEYTPSSGEELQSEYLLPRQAVVEALDAVASVGERVAEVLQISEIRTIAADELWLSPSYRRDSVAFHFTWIADGSAVAPVLDALDERLAPLGARPHWGKLSVADRRSRRSGKLGGAPAAVAARYPRLPDFVDLLARSDPAGKFRNELMDGYFPPSR